MKNDPGEKNRMEYRGKRKKEEENGGKMGERLSIVVLRSFNATFPPKRNLKVGNFWQRTTRHPLLLMKLPPTCTFNFTAYTGTPPSFFPSVLCTQPAAMVFFFLPLLFYLLNGCSPCTQVRRLISCRVHILLVPGPLRVTIVYSLVACYAYPSTSVLP